MAAPGRLSPALLAPVLHARRSLLPYEIRFSAARSMGRLLGPAWSAAGGAAVNTPVQGPDLVLYGGMENAPTGWGAEGASLEASAEAHSGEKALQVTDLGAGFGSANRDVPVQVHAWHAVSLRLKARPGHAARAACYQNASGVYHWRTPVVTQSDYQHFLGALCAGDETVRIKLFAWDAGNTALFDEVRLHALQPGSLLAVLPASEPDVTAGGEWVIAGGFQAGVVLNLDSRSDPQNYLLGYYDRALNQAKLAQCVNGVYSELIAESTPYVEGAVIKVEKEGAACRLFYDHRQIGEEQALSETALLENRLHGVFSTGGGSQLNSFFVTG